AAPKCNATGRLFQSTAPDAKPRSVSFKLVTADSQVSAWIRIGAISDFRRNWRTSDGALILASPRQKAAKLTKVHDRFDDGRFDNVESVCQN
ncbi:hypothetical protein QZM22_18860, partial [Burkholderia oklahomensis]|uniref:hypothetical protein n=1 Tax=Burkholderia oklahomensis TaxID=342113 RepID=UPI0026535B90